MANGEPPLFGRRFTIISAVIVVLGLIYLVLRSDPELRPKLYPPEPVASGLTNPRALAFGADGLLYVAEAGYGGRTSGQVSRITTEGQPEVIATGLPSNPERGRLRPAGPSSLWHLDNALLVASGSADDALLRVRRQQPSVPATDLRAALAKVGLTGTLAPLGLVGDGTHVVVLEAASATLVRLDLREPDNPQPTVVGRLPAGVNALNMAPSADGGWLVVDFGPIPYVQGSGAVWHVSPTGQVERVVEGLTMPVDVTTGAAGELYVVELLRLSTTGAPTASRPAPVVSSWPGPTRAPGRCWPTWTFPRRLCGAPTTICTLRLMERSGSRGAGGFRAFRRGRGLLR